MRKALTATLISAFIFTLGSGLGATPAMAIEPAHRPFENASYWNTPLPVDAPLHPNSAGIANFLGADASANYVLLSGTDSTGDWGQPVYWAESGDPTYNVVQTRYYTPPEFRNLRIPAGADPDPTSDSELTVYDLERGYVAGLWDAHFNGSTNTWSAGGGEIFYLNSNGLDGSLPESDEARNGGAHRGLPPSTYAIRHDEIQAGAINHVLKIGVNNVLNSSHVWPMTGNEPGVSNGNAPVEGARIRIKPSVNLNAMGLSYSALVVARALQTYGAIIGDQTGGPIELKTENTVAEGRGQMWSGLLHSGSLSSIPMSMYEVVQYGYRPPGSDAPPPPAEGPPGTDAGLTDGRGDRADVKVLAPATHRVRANPRIHIRWRTSGLQDATVSISYRVVGSDEGRVIVERTRDDAEYNWRPPHRLRRERMRVHVSAIDPFGRADADRSPAFRMI